MFTNRYITLYIVRAGRGAMMFFGEKNSVSKFDGDKNSFSDMDRKNYSESTFMHEKNLFLQKKSAAQRSKRKKKS